MAHIKCAAQAVSGVLKNMKTVLGISENRNNQETLLIIISDENENSYCSFLTQTV